MGIVLLILAGILEVGLAVHSIITKSNQKYKRNWVRISSFIIFVLFVTIIKWSFRWWLLTAVLFIFGTIAVISLLRNKEEKKYRPVGNIIKAVGVWVLTNKGTTAHAVDKYKVLETMNNIVLSSLIVT